MSVLLDTNIYGRFIEDKQDGLDVVANIVKDTFFIVHNFEVIKKEIQKAPNIRGIYDQIVCNTLIPETKKITELATEYFKKYREKGGNKSKKDRSFFNDLKIVACASIKSFNLIFSDDNKTMKSNLSLKTYEEINLKYNYRTPTFYSYSDLKKKYIY